MSRDKETLSRSELFSTFPKPHHYFYVNFSVMIKSVTVPRAGNHLFKSPLTFGTPLNEKNFPQPLEQTESNVQVLFKRKQPPLCA